MTLNGQMTEEEVRRRSGDGETTPPGPLPSTSEGDLRKGSYRRSKWNRLTTQAVVNDDGTPIGTGIEALLGEVLVELRAIRELLAIRQPDNRHP